MMNNNRKYKKVLRWATEKFGNLQSNIYRASEKVKG